MREWDHGRRFDWDVPEVDRYRVATLLLAAVAALVAVLVATRVFPHHSINHDEGVYLQQAQMLLAGELFLRPPVEDAFRPWFFVEDGDRLYPKYSPVPAAVFALGKLLGGFTVALAGVAAAVVGLTAALGRELFDGRTGLLAGGLVLASPLFLVQSGVYLPYALTTALNLAFALAYLRAERRGSLRAAVVAGAAVALAFFARPYTAVLFAAPFVAHACWTLVRSGAWRTAFGADGDGNRALLERRVVTASLGTAGVLVALGYNWVVTGDPLVFPYQAFAPHDGVGFGHREILGHEADYDLELATRSNGLVLRRLFTDWVVAGPLGTVLAAAGVAVALAKRGSPSATQRALLAGLFLSIPLGNLAFWGNFNVLGDLSVQRDGLIHFLGPYYHFDLVVPTAIFAAYAGVFGADRLRTALEGRLSAAGARRVAAAAVLVSATAFGAVAVDTADGPLERNYDAGQELEAAYEPFDDGAPGNAVVFLPEPYGPWLNHPIQGLRNDPSFDGATVYALDGDELPVAAAYPDRELYRYVYAGSWSPTDGQRVDAGLQPVDRVAGETVQVDATTTLPAGADGVTLRLSTDTGSTYVVANGTEETLDLTVTVDGDRATLSGPSVPSTANATAAVERRDEVTLEVFVATGGASGFTYRIEFPIAADDGQIRALSPTSERCQVPTRCTPVGVDGVAAESIETTVRAGSN
ncbi:Dolichyl-phosphate-mannose-protein mannosyltransferase [Halomicrobium zhouii]|uniref:Dolichyl-phosphate-mannose-protein mannosyltransferase n=1 Tax=Halomicrobium zhouii TaxID=767519 RepID=A0A1I6KBM6_9EURY|nr:glycosyltransferase family 39 protein [Halomicrobium zhouii]SFR88695.1 Dolichyl-phosphate-mannose-protein mannosyltransferase [Halomicrobium zhouii]